MHENTIRFTELDSDLSFANLASALNTRPVQGIIRMSTDTGKGMIRKINFEDGFNFRAWDIQPNQELFFRKLPAQNPSGEKTFHIVYLLKPRCFDAGSFHLGEHSVQDGKNVVFINNHTTVGFDVARDFQFKAIELSFSSSWLRESFKQSDDHTRAFIAQLEESERATAVMDTCSFSDFKMLMTLHEKAVQAQNGILEMKAGSLSLISDFMNRLFSHQPHEVLGSRIFHYHRMLEVEKILKDHLQKKLPSIDAIAHQVALSVSTLKRHFKLMYGKSIYEYYLDLKMEFARRMLQERPLTINEVAAILDYEKVSSFIDMFKKHFGYCPGNIRKNGILR